MRHPLESIPTDLRRPFFVLSLILTLVVIAAMQSVSRPLSTTAAPSGIISYELARDAATAQAIIDSWDSEVRIRAGFGLGLDYLFLALYSTVIACACAWLAATFRERARPLATVGTLLAWGQLLAAVLDAVENAALLTMLFRPPTPPWPMVAWGCAIVKFGLVLLGFLFALAGGILLLLTPRRRPA